MGFPADGPHPGPGRRPAGPPWKPETSRIDSPRCPCVLKPLSLSVVSITPLSVHCPLSVVSIVPLSVVSIAPLSVVSIAPLSVASIAPLSVVSIAPL